MADEDKHSDAAPAKDGGEQDSQQAEAGTHEDAAKFLRRASTKEGGSDESEGKAEMVSKSDYDALRAELDEMKRKSESAEERAEREVRESARAEGRKEATDEFAAVLLRTAIRAQNPDLSADELDELVEETNLAAFVTDDGVDEEKLLRRAERAAGTTRATGPDLGQGTRGGSRSVSGYEAGQDFFEARHGKRN